MQKNPPPSAEIPQQPIEGKPLQIPIILGVDAPARSVCHVAHIGADSHADAYLVRRRPRGFPYRGRQRV